jgi:hypothetical protein
MPPDSYKENRNRLAKGDTVVFRPRFSIFLQGRLPRVPYGPFLGEGNTKTTGGSRLSDRPDPCSVALVGFS